MNMISIRHDAAEELPADNQIVLAGWLGPIGSLGAMNKQIARRVNGCWETFSVDHFWYEPVDPDYWWSVAPSERSPHEMAKLVAADDMETLLGNGGDQ